MKLLAVLLLMALPFSSILGNDDFNPQSEFNRGNFQLEERNFDEALSIYSEILESGFESGPLYLNIGLAHTYLEEFGHARFYFMKAAEFNQTSQQGTDGITYIDEILLQRHTPIPVLATFKLQQWLFTQTNPNSFYLWALILFNIAGLFLALSFFKENIKRLSVYTAVILLVGSIGLAFTGNFISRHYEFVDLGIVVQHNARVYESADLSGDPVFQLYQGYTFLIDRRNSTNDDQGAFVLMSNGIEGWIPRDAFLTF